ncbi:DUF1826 domain-containing protein (plasmid) [Acinetobacter sp. NCu2D-2]|uniref:DUF1826 domain-containing protein n=1 Tax=Acinetobacter sp. NCu2D-2 TaxID=1608473 RepID=UPI0007CDCE95|nr:DUF1826 domain-containing protein [Acinetobacter sp. NCu2D-2]ANF83333.1 DUF1826 domain-containing protein [Acinetobacter sp. NCu2D-2]
MHRLEQFPQIISAPTFEDLIHIKFTDTKNAACWQRNLSGDFSEIIEKFKFEENLIDISIEELMQLDLTNAGKQARQTIIDDINKLSKLGYLPQLNIIKYYERDEELDFISTDVYSYHVDRSPIATDTFLCTYFGAASDILPNDQVQQKILIPEIRDKLKALYRGPESEFEFFLQEYFFDLHYQALPHAEPINLGIGNMWKLAVDHPDQTVPPCVHRAPLENPNEPRLLLIC